MNHPAISQRSGGAYRSASLPSFGTLLRSVSVALGGIDAVTLAADAPHREILRRDGVAAAFGPGAVVATVDCGPGLWSLLRTSADGRARVLCVYNITDEPVTFSPAAHLIGRPRDQAAVFFLAGATTTAEKAAILACEVAPRGFVWLGRFAERTRRPY